MKFFKRFTGDSSYQEALICCCNNDPGGAYSRLRDAVQEGNRKAEEFMQELMSKGLLRQTPHANSNSDDNNTIHLSR